MQESQSSNAVSLAVCLISNVLFSPSLLDAGRLGAFRPVDRYFRAELLKQRESISEAAVMALSEPLLPHLLDLMI